MVAPSPPSPRSPGRQSLTSGWPLTRWRTASRSAPVPWPWMTVRRPAPAIAAWSRVWSSSSMTSSTRAPRTSSVDGMARGGPGRAPSAARAAAASPRGGRGVSGAPKSPRRPVPGRSGGRLARATRARRLARRQLAVLQLRERAPRRGRHPPASVARPRPTSTAAMVPTQPERVEARSPTCHSPGSPAAPRQVPRRHRGWPRAAAPGAPSRRRGGTR